ncbi:uncharacterized protein LOC128182055 [Crassostrea angulata]|uniref:uncharacterized protein LOC128182055 n=1 Tax=Magallana angulata TaxID=2784310 RepID=UPI0022B0CE98|nr:uncharacterized protein LOC128182055 [Crassostrea angulata]
MSSRVKLLLKLGLILAPLTLVSTYHGASFVMVIEMNDIRFDQWIISSLSARSRLDCSKTCEIHGTCLSVQFSPLTGQCRLYNTIFLHQHAGVYDIGWQYYIATKRRCRDPFIDGRDLNICFMFAGFHDMTEAKAKCTAIQSSIISITSEQENHFLKRLAGSLSSVSMPNDSYIRPFIQGFWNGIDWILDDGTPLVYTNWANGQPQITRQYIKLSKEGWKTTYFSSIRPVFCSYKP